MKQKKRWILYSLNFFVFAAISMVNTQIIPYLGKVGYDVVAVSYTHLTLPTNSLV